MEGHVQTKIFRRERSYFLDDAYFCWLPIAIVRICRKTQIANKIDPLMMAAFVQSLASLLRLRAFCSLPASHSVLALIALQMAYRPQIQQQQMVAKIAQPAETSRFFKKYQKKWRKTFIKIQENFNENQGNNNYIIIL